MLLSPQVVHAVDFLRSWAPDGPWVLTAIPVEPKETRTRTFRDLDDAAAWVQEWNGQRQWNIYFNVNPTIGDLDKKSLREDIARMDWLHVDVDPRAGEDLAEEHARIQDVVKNPPPGIPPATCIIFSGGGYQAFWRLAEPLPINGDLAAAEDAKRYNLQIERAFGGDHCHNIDRIMRLPGTVNFPNKKKQKKGRVPVLAQLVEWHDDRVYPISSFVPAPVVQQPDTGFARTQIEIPGNLKRLSGVDDLGDAVPDWVKVIVVQGHDPEDPGRYPSRSEALFAVCCELVRAGIEPEVIYSVITDPDFLISASVLDKGSSAEKYARRQIGRAMEEAIHPMLRLLNEKHAVIGNYGGKCRVIEDRYDPALGRSRLSQQSFADFQHRYMNKKVQVGETKDGDPRYEELGKWWLRHEQRRQYENVVFSPRHEVPDAYNLWTGFSCEPRPGNCDLYLAHILDNICQGNRDHYEYVLSWMARCVQFPDSPGETAIILRGRMGTGKSIFAKGFGNLFGRHFLQLSNTKHLVGSFNAHLRDCVVLFGDEAFWAGDKRNEGSLKTMVTEETIAIESKGIDVELAPNYLHLIMASNNDWVVPAGLDERRFVVLDVSAERIQDATYFGAIKEQLNNGGQEALLHLLMTRDISEFNVRALPKTAGLMDQKVLSMSVEQEWWFHKLEDGRILSQHSGWDNEVEKDVLLNDYMEYAQRVGSFRRLNATAFGRFIRKVVPRGLLRSYQRRVSRLVELPTGEQRYAEKRPYFYGFPPLDKCRAYFDTEFGGPFPWPTIEETDWKKEQVVEEQPF